MEGRLLYMSQSTPLISISSLSSYSYYSCNRNSYSINRKRSGYLFLSLKTNSNSKLKQILKCSSSSSPHLSEVDGVLAVKKKAVELLPTLRGTSIFLVGIKSAVKTSLGELLADALRYYYFDSDTLVEDAAGTHPSGKSFKQRDIQGFNESETEVLKQLSSMGRLVVCAGDGAVQSSTNLSLLRYGLSIWIDIPLEMVAADIVGKGTQPHSSQVSTSASHSEVLDQLTTLYEEMKGGYGTADATISLYGVASRLGYDDLNAVTIEDLALEVLKEIEKLTRVKKMMEEAARPF